jgi:type II secretory pathway pseudopilin PulG
VELLVTIGMIALLAALLLPALSKGKAQAQSSSCKSRLRQIGLALNMHASDTSRYPPMGGSFPYQTWADRLQPYYPLNWTNASWNCPTFLSKNGSIHGWSSLETNSFWSASYSYNWRGIVGAITWTGAPPSLGELTLGLGQLPKNAAREPEVLAPSEMYAVATINRTPRHGPHAITGLCRSSKPDLSQTRL